VLLSVSFAPPARTLTLAAVALLGCSQPEPPAQDAVTRYALTRMGSRALPQLAYFRTHSSCTGWLLARHYELAGNRWTLIDTLVERCDAEEASKDSTKVRRDSGTFLLRNDTIQFTIPSAIRGEGRTLLGVLRGDTLATWPGSLRSNDHIYVRR
jgi:hypothetical protein